MVVFVRYDNVPLSCNSHSCWAIELAWTHSFSTKLVLELTVRVENLDSVIASIADNDVPLLVTTDAPWATELAVLRAVTSKKLCHNSKSTIFSSTINKQLEWTAINVSASNSDVKLVLPLVSWSKVD